MLGMNTAQVVAFLVRRVGSHGSGLERARRLAAFPSADEAGDGLPDHPFALGVPSSPSRSGSTRIAVDAFRQGYEQWDGKGVPQGLRGDEIALPARLVQLAGPVEVYARRHGDRSRSEAVRRHRGAELRSRQSSICSASTLPACWTGSTKRRSGTR